MNKTLKYKLKQKHYSYNAALTGCNPLLNNSFSSTHFRNLKKQNNVGGQIYIFTQKHSFKTIIVNGHGSGTYKSDLIPIYNTCNSLVNSSLLCLIM